MSRVLDLRRLSVELVVVVLEAAVVVAAVGAAVMIVVRRTILGRCKPLPPRPLLRARSLRNIITHSPTTKSNNNNIIILSKSIATSGSSNIQGTFDQGVKTKNIPSSK